MDKIRGYLRLSSLLKPAEVKAWSGELIHRFKRDSLFQNSVYLMLTSAIMAIFGFAFWIIAARVYSTTEIGFATALISATILLSSLSLLGFDMALIRYLPRAKKPNVLINTALAVVGVAALVISAGYLLGINHFAPIFHELTGNISYAIFFMIFLVMVTINTLTDSVFVAFRASKYNLIVYTFFGITKVALPLALVGFGAYGIFFAYTGAVVVSLGLSIFFMFKRVSYRPHWMIEKEVAKKMTKFSLANYVAAFMSGMPILIMPTLMVHSLGTEQSAYYYMASTIANMLYIIPIATTEALFAEGSNDEQGLGAFVKSAAKLITVLLVPAILVLTFGGKYILLIFGTAYSQHSVQVLQIMAATSIFVAINLVAGAILKVNHRMKELLAVNLCYLIGTLALIYALLPHGVLGAALALGGGQALASALFFGLFYIRRNNKAWRLLGATAE